MTRPLIKRALEAALLHLGPAALARSRRRGRAVVLAYHNIVPRGESTVGDASLHLPQRAFAAQLDILGDACEVVPLSSLLSDGGGPVAGAAEDQAGARPRVAITFDDAYEGALTAGVEELRARGLPATVFASPGLLDGRTFWWDATAAGADPAWRGEALGSAYGHPDLVRERRLAGGGSWNDMPAHARSASAGGVRAFAELPGMALGAHGWLHLNFAAAPPDALANELAAPRGWLAEARPRGRAGPFPLAYPYGLSTAAVARAAAEAGYAHGLLVSGGWLPRAPVAGSFSLPRLNVPAGISSAGFRLRLAGLLGG
ncbi:MAG TPA: polysaccharide deacetylase family protein [Longimicrobiales bacterium]|nr:polysaccharide deacetylase family protein [Longimicrobiales bacterium]